MNPTSRCSYLPNQSIDISDLRLEMCIEEILNAPIGAISNFFQRADQDYYPDIARIHQLSRY
jgi:hypothetical protein